MSNSVKTDTASGQQLPLSGIHILEIAGGASAAYCARLLCDLGAQVTRVALNEAERVAGLGGESPTDAAYAAYLLAGKCDLGVEGDMARLEQRCREADVVLVGEESSFDEHLASPRVLCCSLTWFGRKGPYRHWVGAELVVQALTGLTHLVGPVDGPPLQFGERQSSVVAGVTASIAVLAGLVGARAGVTRRMGVSILEACLALSEMHFYTFQRDKQPQRRHGLNRFMPNGPVGVYPCKTGWLGITCATNDQWVALCNVLGLAHLGTDPSLATRELRFPRLDEIEHALCETLAARSADEWAELGRRAKIPVVVVPDAQALLASPVMAERGALATLQHDGREMKVPRTPFSLTGSPMHQRLEAGAAPPQGATWQPGEGHDDDGDQPLRGLQIVDFTMGWAGPLATRMMADLGAEVLKIEAGRYPDWWRGVFWTDEFVRTKQYERAPLFTGMNRGKHGLSLDLTTAAGRDVALRLVEGAEAVLENQSAGVMGKFGLGYEHLVAVNPNVVMVSMSAFGIGNALSETRAYGSTLEQASGLPWFAGREGDPPTMVHLAYGDAVGGLFGCAATLAGVLHKRRTGQGQLANMSLVENMIQMTTPALLEHQMTGRPPRRHGNRNPRLAPHGIYPSQGEDQWLALCAQDDAAFARLATAIGKPEWARDSELASAQGRRRREDEIDAAIARWSCERSSEEAANQLQSAQVAAAPVLRCDDLFAHEHIRQSGYFVDIVRGFSGPQGQGGLPIEFDGRRVHSHKAAPTLGEDSWAVLERHLGMAREDFDALVRDGIVTFEPRGLRSMASSQAAKA